jgi:hypothetical protein
VKEPHSVLKSPNRSRNGHAVLALFFGAALACHRANVCEDMKEGLPRDQCFHDRILGTPPAEYAKIRPTALLIHDNIVRSAAIHSWVLANAGKFPRDDAVALCDLLQQPESDTCKKRLLAAHLQRK